ncbi:MAG: adenosylcobinamide-GDP ribazoletransferase [Nitrospira sp.]|nr:adenosylcobinamide-GDP ribazoletransferase [Nitrospira sp.]
MSFLSSLSHFALHLSRSFVIAWQFLTAIPVARSCDDPEPGELASSMGWYPLIGLILGVILAVSDFLLAQVFSDHVVNGLLIVLLVVLTRGLHQDGLADTLDGLAGGRSPVERLAIMRDGRIGAIGATGLALVLGLKYAGLTDLPDEERLTLLLCLPAAGRWAMVVSAISAPYARSEGGLAQPFIAYLSMGHVAWASCTLGLALLWAVGPVGALSCLAVLGIAVYAMTLFARRLFGGITGDTLGAVNEIAEVLFLLAAPLFLGAP